MTTEGNIQRAPKSSWRNLPSFELFDPEWSRRAFFLCKMTLKSSIWVLILLLLSIIKIWSITAHIRFLSVKPDVEIFEKKQLDWRRVTRVWLIERGVYHFLIMPSGLTGNRSCDLFFKILVKTISMKDKFLWPIFFVQTRGASPVEPKITRTFGSIQENVVSSSAKVNVTFGSISNQMKKQAMESTLVSDRLGKSNIIKTGNKPIRAPYNPGHRGPKVSCSSFDQPKIKLQRSGISSRLGKSQSSAKGSVI